MSQLTTRDQLMTMVPPEGIDTGSYTAVAHAQLLALVDDVAKNVLVGSDKVGEAVMVARGGAKMFARMTFRSEEPLVGDSRDLMIGIRNSYNKEMALGIAVGAQVRVCSNGMFAGDIVSMRRHTVNVWDDIQMLVTRALLTSGVEMNRVERFVSCAKQMTCEIDRGYEILGLLIGNDVLRPREFGVALGQWQKPDYEEFQERNLWSLYNAATFALKESHVATVLRQHRALHETFNSLVFD